MCWVLVILIHTHLGQVVGSGYGRQRETLQPLTEVIHRQHCLRAKEGGQLFSDWSFSINSPLLQLPTDPEKNNYVRKVFNSSFSQVSPEPFLTSPFLAAISPGALRNALDLNPCDCVQSKAFLLLASGGRPLLPNSLSLAHRYGGHQFGYWAGQLGDGRAVLVGTYTSQQGEYWELQLKGSGKTPYSRSGDGRAVLRSSVREFLASEAMFSLGIPSSRAASLTVSNDFVWRDQFYDGHPRQERTAIVLRLAPSWFRIGSLEILRVSQEHDLLRQTVDFVLEQHFPHLVSVGGRSSRYVAFYATMVNQTAWLIAHWQAVGFTHGVCNTDNFSLLSLTIDYGPFGFMDHYDPDFVPNTSDDEGRYRYQYQPSVGHYNLQKLLEALEPLLKENSAAWQEANTVLLLYPSAFNIAYQQLMAQKLGFIQPDIAEQEELEAVVMGLLQIMEAVQADYSMTFRELSEVTTAQLVSGHLPRHLWALPRLLGHPAWRNWLSLYHFLTLAPATNGPRPQAVSYIEGLRWKLMQQTNPRYVLRNWMAEQAIQQAEEGDLSVVHRLHRLLQDPFRVQTEAETAGYARPPPAWAQALRVSCSS